MAMERVAALIQRAAQDTGFVSELGQQPDRLQSALGLTHAHMAALRSATALATPPVADAGGAVPDSATLYPPEGTGTMDPGYVVLPGPAPLPPGAYFPSPPPLSFTPRASPPQPAPFGAPAPGETPPYGVVPRPAPAAEPGPTPVPSASPQPYGQPAAPTTPSAPPVCPSEVIPAPGPCTRSGQPLPVQHLLMGRPPASCCQPNTAAIVAAVSQTAIPAITAITAIAGLRR
jgi:hypothetical protein